MKLLCQSRSVTPGSLWHTYTCTYICIYMLYAVIHNRGGGGSNNEVTWKYLERSNSNIVMKERRSFTFFLSLLWFLLNYLKYEHHTSKTHALPFTLSKICYSYFILCWVIRLSALDSYRSIDLLWLHELSVDLVTAF